MDKTTNKKWVIYMHIFPNNKRYIGVAIINEGETPKRACINRWGHNGEGYKTQRVYRAIKKYGWENVKHEILFECVPEDQVDELEIYLIKKYNSQIDEGNGYNIDYGGKHRIVSEYTRRRLSDSLSGEKHPNYGKHHSEETKRRIALGNIGKVVSEESRKRMSDAQNWQNGENNPRYGKHCTENEKRNISNGVKKYYDSHDGYWKGKHLSSESKRKLSDKAKERYKDKTRHPNYGVKFSQERCDEISKRNSKPILVYDLFGNYLGEYKSCTYYANLIGISFSAVCNAAKFNTITCDNKLIFYKDEFSEDELTRRLDSFKDTRKFKKYYYYKSAKELFDIGYTRKQVCNCLGITWEISDACYKLMLELSA